MIFTQYFRIENNNIIKIFKYAAFWMMHNHSLLFSYIINVIAAIAIICIGMGLASSFSKNINKIFLARHLDITVADFLSMLLRYSIITFSVTAALNRVGVQTASIITVLGAAGLAVGLSLQGSLSNLAAGVLLVIFRPLRVGEYVDLGGINGIVQQIQIFSTTLLSADGKTIVVPNGKVIAGNIINYSREPIRRSEMIIRVSINSDIKKIKEILTKIVYADSRIIKEREIIIKLHEIHINYLNFIVRWWGRGKELQNIYWDLLEKCQLSLRQEQNNNKEA
ncbi:MAG: small-conductance mechanosensitive channel MscS [Candidatus Dasytiphilus stammeri]